MMCAMTMTQTQIDVHFIISVFLCDNISVFCE